MGTESSWLLRQAEYLGENLVKQAVWDMDAMLPYGRELVLKDFEVVSQFQALPPKDIPICFDRAVIGLGSQCGLSYCAKNTPTEIYQSYKEQIRNFYWNTTMRWNGFQERRAQEEVSSVSNFSPLKCLKTARYYGFEDEEDLKERKDFSPNLSPHEEPFIRRGERDPDSIDLLSNGKRRSNPVVALIERRTNRAVLNLDHVISTIVESGHFRLKVLNYDLGCGIPETAYLMRDVNILISPHGNALGGSLWMASPSDNDINPFPTVISIDSTKYYESWFQWTTTAMAQRFILHRCGPAVSYLSDPKEGVCPLYRNLDLARKIINELGLTLDKSTQEEDLLALTGVEFPIELLQRYSDINRKNGDTSEEWAIKMSTFLSSYWKKLARYADPDRLLQTLERIRDENTEDRIDTRVGQSKSKLSYLQLCMQGRCCGPECEGVMNRNVVGALRAYDQDISEGNWGEFLPNEEHSRFMRSGERLKSWIE
ncbi:hypothetical protein BGZ49_009766 [Haplosporangium sp. Z 27]|nr:hypothetical protein BGZ49_009766 [Haplosporangium sp. Z 27]